MIALLVTFVSRLTKREKAAFYGTIIVVSMLLLDKLMLTPILDKINYYDYEIAKTEEAVEKALGIVDREKDLTARAAVYAVYLKKPLPDDKEKLSLLEHIQRLASKSSVITKEIRANLKLIEQAGGEGEGAAEVKMFVVSLTCEGEMPELASFFYDIEEFREKLLRIDSFYMTLKKRKDLDIITCTMEISRHVIK